VLVDQRGAGGHEVGRRALEHDPAAVTTGPGAEVDDPIEQAQQVLDIGEVEPVVGSSRTYVPPRSDMWVAS
jgi:hypothetical protein